MIAAKKLLNKPIKTLKEMKMKEMQRTFLLTVPETCKSYATKAFDLTMSDTNLKKVDLGNIEPMKLIGFATRTIRDEAPEKNQNSIKMTKIEPIVTGQMKQLLSKGKKVYPEKSVVFPEPKTKEVFSDKKISEPKIKKSSSEKKEIVSQTFTRSTTESTNSSVTTPAINTTSKTVSKKVSQNTTGPGKNDQAKKPIKEKLSPPT